MTESTEVKVARVEVQVQGIKEDLNKFRVEVLQRMDSLYKKLDNTELRYVTKEELSVTEDKMNEIKRIATTRLWQAVALTALLSVIVTSMASYILAKALR